MHQRRIILPLSVIFTMTLSLHADRFDWPQWRGLDRTGKTTEADLLEKWPESGPEQLWVSRDAGLGYSGPAVVGNRLVTMGLRGEAEQLICLDVETGQELWTVDVGGLYENGWGDGPRSTPTVDEDRVYALGAKGDLVCVRLADGEMEWRTTLTDFGGAIPNWGYSESVLIDGDRLLCTPGGDQGAILALDKKTGEKIWQTADFTDPAHYASIIVAEHDGQRQYIQLTEQSVVGIAADSGNVLWQTPWPGRVAVVPTPIFANGHVYVSSGYGVGCDLFRIANDGTVESVYDDRAKKVLKNHHGGVILVDDHLYGYSDGVGWVCQELMSGKMVWRDRESLGKGSLCFADGRLYCVDKDGGEVVLITATPDGWEEHGRFKLSPQTELRKPKGRIWTHPVVANGKLFLRDQELLFCYDVKE